MEDTIMHSGDPEPETDPEQTALEASGPDFSSAPTYVAGAGVDDLEPVDSATAVVPTGPSNPLQLALNALLLKESAFHEVRQADSPIQKGLTVLVIVLVIAAVAQAIGTAFDVLTSPPLDRIQEVVMEQVRQMPQVQELLSDPEAAEFLSRFMDGIFRVVRFVAPSWPGAGVALCLSPIFGFVVWAVYGLLTQVSAKIFGGRAAMPQFLGVLALAYAPVLLRVGNLLPGAIVVNGLVSWWVLATSYLAVKTTHELSWARSLGAVLIPRVVIGVLLFACALLAGVGGPLLLLGGGG